MEAKKTVKIIFVIAAAAVLIFFLVLFFNSGNDSSQIKMALDKETVNIANSEKQQSYTAVNLPTVNENDFISGSKSAPVSILIYEDYADYFSADFAVSLDKAKNDFGDKLNFVFRPFNVGGSELSNQAALSVRCAADYGQGDKWREKVFAAVRNHRLNVDDFLAWATEIGLNKEDFEKCLTNSEKKERIEELMAQAENFSVFGAPTIFVGEEMIIGARPYETFSDSNGDEIEGLKQFIERQLN